MNILLTNATTIFAGGEDYVLILARFLAKRGHRVWVSANPDHLLLHKCEASGIPTIPIQYGDMGKVFSVGTLLRNEINRLDIDIVHSNANYDRTCAAIGVLFTKAKHVAGVHSGHSIQHNVTHWWRNKFGTAHFIADADSVKNVMTGEDGISGQCITVVPIGVENDTEEYRLETRWKTRAAWNLSQDAIVIGNVARLTEFKGQKFLLAAIAEVAKTCPNVVVPIVGDGELLRDLQSQAKRLNIEKVIRFLGFQDNLNELYPAFDIYCHPSIERAAEAFPIAILRALAGALPVVATDVGGIRLMVENRISGFLTEPEDAQALAGGLLQLSTNRALRESMGKESFELFKKKFHAHAMAERVEQVYAKVLSS